MLLITKKKPKAKGKKVKINISKSFCQIFNVLLSLFFLLAKNKIYVEEQYFRNHWNTPLIKLNKITKDLPCTVLAKVEYFNPGQFH